MIINSELFLRTFQIIESEPLPILFILHPYYANVLTAERHAPGGASGKNPARENLGRDIVVRISRYNRPESIAAGDGHPLARYRCDTEGLLLNRPCIGRILFVVAHHLFQLAFS